MASANETANKAFQQAVRQHRATLDRLLDRRAVLGLRRYFDQAQDQLEKMMRRQARGAKHESLSPLQAQQLLLQVRAAQQQIASRLAQLLTPTLRETQEVGVEEADRALTKLEKGFTGILLALPLSELSTRAKLAERRSAQLVTSNGAAFDKFSVSVSEAVEKALSVSLALEESPQEAVDRARAAADSAWWQAQRIVQTTMAYAFNQAQADAIEEVAGAFKGLGKRWCELVDDETGLPLDNRVGNDSIALHGQVTDPNGLFVMPPDPSVHRSFWNKAWSSSPNRPNDRSVTMPWRQEWGIPGWRWLNGARVPIGR